MKRKGAICEGAKSGVYLNYAGNTPGKNMKQNFAKTWHAQRAGAKLKNSRRRGKQDFSLGRSTTTKAIGRLGAQPSSRKGIIWPEKCSGKKDARGKKREGREELGG